jgi:hypothetical protein
VWIADPKAQGRCAERLQTPGVGIAGRDADRVQFRGEVLRECTRGGQRLQSELGTIQRH